MESPAVTLARLALDAASLRHQAIANNIANASSPGFMPMKVNFEEQLAFARGGLRGNVPAFVRPFLEVDAGGGQRMLDEQVARLAQNTVHYQSLLKALEKRGAIVAAAVNEGRR